MLKDSIIWWELGTGMCGHVLGLFDRHWALMTAFDVRSKLPYEQPPDPMT